MPSRRKMVPTFSASWGRASDISDLRDCTSESEEIEIKDHDDEDYGFKLPYFKACLFATILEDIISQLRILDECNFEIRISKTMAEMDKLLAKKHGVKEKSTKDELDDIDPKKLNCVEYKLKKLHSDRHFVLQVLTKIYIDLAKSRTIESLKENVNRIVENRAHLTNLIEMEAKNKALRREMNRQLRQQRNHIKSVTYDTNNEIEIFKSGLEDNDLNVEIRKRYVIGWQRARTEQHLQMIQDKEIKPLENIEKYKQKIDQEERVHKEIELLINIKINETLIKVEEWMNKYDKDIENMDLKIQLKKNAYEHIYERRLELEETLANHEVQLHNWVTYKEEREAERQYRDRINNAAITVQAWWRGLLVRKELGPYKPVKRKPPPKPEEKSEKKKKKK